LAGIGIIGGLLWLVFSFLVLLFHGFKAGGAQGGMSRGEWALCNASVLVTFIHYAVVSDSVWSRRLLVVGIAIHLVWFVAVVCIVTLSGGGVLLTPLFFAGLACWIAYAATVPLALQIEPSLVNDYIPLVPGKGVDSSDAYEGLDQVPMAERPRMIGALPRGAVYFRTWQTLRWFLLLTIPLLASGIAWWSRKDSVWGFVGVCAIGGACLICLFVALCSGMSSSNNGTVFRHREPIRFWLDILLTTLGYFAMSVVGYFA
jgi:hypothetical protein